MNQTKTQDKTRNSMSTVTEDPSPKACVRDVAEVCPRTLGTPAGNQVHLSS